jgi:hypothetical protein
MADTPLVSWTADKCFVVIENFTIERGVCALEKEMWQPLFANSTEIMILNGKVWKIFRPITTV